MQEQMISFPAGGERRAEYMIEMKRAFKKKIFDFWCCFVHLL
jgi:hypothetical protein